MWIGSLAILGALAAAAVWGVRRSGRRSRDRSPLEILDERFAQGELDAEEYRSSREILEGTR